MQELSERLLNGRVFLDAPNQLFHHPVRRYKKCHERREVVIFIKGKT